MFFFGDCFNAVSDTKKTKVQNHKKFHTLVQQN